MKGKFIFIIPDGDSYQLKVKPSSFSEYPEGTQFNLTQGLGIPLGKFSTDDLLKVKAQIATELENRMDLDDVVESNFNNLKETIRNAESYVIAQIMRQTLDRLDVINSDEKRSKTRLQILEDELRHRMLQDGVSEMKFKGSIQATYQKETVFNVGEEGWDTVYSGIVAETLEHQIENTDLSANVDISDVTTQLLQTTQETLLARIEIIRGKLRREKDIHGEDITSELSLLDDLATELKTVGVNFNDDEIISSLVHNVAYAMVDNVRDGITNIDAFSILQKRLTSTTLKELLKQGEELPRGVVSQEIQKLKIKRTK